MSDDGRSLPPPDASPASPAAEKSAPGPSGQEANERPTTYNAGGNAGGGNADSEAKALASVQAYIQSATTNNIHLGSFLKEILSLVAQPLEIHKGYAEDARAKADEYLVELQALKSLALTTPPFEEVFAQWEQWKSEIEGVRAQAESFRSLMEEFDVRTMIDQKTMDGHKRQIQRYQETIRENGETFECTRSYYENLLAKEKKKSAGLQACLDLKDADIKDLKTQLAKSEGAREGGESMPDEFSEENREWRDKVDKWVKSCAEMQNCMDNMDNLRRRTGGVGDTIQNAETNLRKCEDNLRELHKMFCDGGASDSGYGS